MELVHASPTRERATETNRKILDGAMTDHDKHYWCLCKWIERELAKRKDRRRWHSGPEAIGDLFSTGHTVATVIWETYTGKRT